MDDLPREAQPKVAEELADEVKDIVMGWLSGCEGVYMSDMVGRSWRCVSDEFV